MDTSQPPTMQPVAIPRPQVGIERLPTRRPSNEPRELMNCKSCRKRKIKCNRVRPSCEACQIFQCPCIYDATPKKRGPKGDVLEALLRRVDGLEAKLKEKNSTGEVSPTSLTDATEASASTLQGNLAEAPGRPNKRLAIETGDQSLSNDTAQSSSSVPTGREASRSPAPNDALLDTYFNRLHARPYYILDESSVRQRMQLKQLPNYLEHAISAVAARYTPHASGYQAAVKLSEDHATIARREVNTDNPSIDALQTLLLLVVAFTAAGKGKKAYMLMTIAVGMSTALELHREMDPSARVTPVERELRRRLFWTCYLLDRFNACGSKRPSLINDETIMLRLPCWSPSPSSLPIDGEFFQTSSNHQHFQGIGRKSQGSTGLLIDVTRILGTTNSYLAAGGVKGDSHFPWHSLSKLSKIRHDLDVWASGTDDTFSDIGKLFGQVDSSVLVLSKLIYHLIHCVIYRPFLPIDLTELTGNAQHQSWQIEATNICFLHANSISEIIDTGKQTSAIEWPAFVGYCICTAATVHIHGAHYSRQGAGGDTSAFSLSTEYLSREMQQLSELRYAWASVQHQRETLQDIYNAHAELVQSLATESSRYKQGFQLEDFFKRYADIGGPGGRSFAFDAANLSLVDLEVDFAVDAYNGDDLFAPRIAEAPADIGLKRKLGHTSAMSRHHGGSSRATEQVGSGTTRPAQMRRYTESDKGSLGNAMATPQAHQLLAFASAEAPASVQTPTYQLSTMVGRPRENEFTGFRGIDLKTAPAWTGDTNHNFPGSFAANAPGVQTASPGNASASTAQGEDRDPFLNLLEQLAENERQVNAEGGGDLDFLGNFNRAS